MDHPALRDLLTEHWEWSMASSPEWATSLGDRRFDDRLADNSREGLAAIRTANRRWLARALAIEEEHLAQADRTTRSIFIEQLEATIASEVCRFEEWSLSPRHNPVTQWNYLPQRHRVVTPNDGRNLVARYGQIARTIDNEIEHLRRGARSGRFANAESIRRLLSVVRGQLEQPLEKWPMLAPVRRDVHGWSREEQQHFRDDLTRLVRSEIRPALERYAAVVEEELLPHARADDEAGVGMLPGGDACYAARIRTFTGLPLTAADLHRTGMEELSRINEEMRALGEKLFGEPTLAGTLQRLRTDPTLFFTSEEEIEKKAIDSLTRATERMGAYFGILPKAACTVVRVPPYEAPFTTIAYYRGPHADGSKPGEYFVNTFEPHTRPRYEAEALAFHEAVPGHHLQIAISQELAALPAFRRHTGLTAFVEGWALYAERLADEMQLYSGDLDRMGMLSYDAWRAARLVVDTGIHAFGWSGEQAIRFMLEHTALAANNIRNEVDRYISWPGQALGYKVGQLEILRLRREAEQALGNRFDLRGFHDVVLQGGAVTLPVLETQIRDWIAAQR